MTNELLCKMMEMYFEDDRPLATKPQIAWKQCSWLGQVLQPQLVMPALSRTPAQPYLLSRAY